MASMSHPSPVSAGVRTFGVISTRSAIPSHQGHLVTIVLIPSCPAARLAPVGNLADSHLALRWAQAPLAALAAGFVSNAAARQSTRSPAGLAWRSVTLSSIWKGRAVGRSDPNSSRWGVPASSGPIQWPKNNAPVEHDAYAHLNRARIERPMIQSLSSSDRNFSSSVKCAMRCL